MTITGTEKKMSSAYYSRANSYSRSYNAHVAESENRYPLTRAAQWLGISAATFKTATDACDIYSSEWHHVGKYANRIDYWDAAEIAETPAFWFWILKNKKGKSKSIAQVNLSRIARNRWQMRCRPAVVQSVNRYERFKAAFARRCNQLNIYAGNRNIIGIKSLDTATLKTMAKAEQAKRHNQNAVSKSDRKAAESKTLRSRLAAYKEANKSAFIDKWSNYAKANAYAIVMGQAVPNETYTYISFTTKDGYNWRDILNSEHIVNEAIYRLTKLTREGVKCLFDYAAGNNVVYETVSGRRYDEGNIFTNPNKKYDDILISLENGKI